MNAQVLAHRVSPAFSVHRMLRVAVALTLGAVVFGFVGSAHAQLTNPDPTPILIDPNYYNGLWRQTGRTEARRAHSLADFEADRLGLLSTHKLFDVEHLDGWWTGVWKEANGQGEHDRLLLDIDAAQLGAVQAAERVDGFELVDLELEVQNGVLVAFGVWHPGVPQTEVHLGLAMSDNAPMIAPQGAAGYALTDVEAYEDVDGVVRWATLWSNEPLGTTFHVAIPGEISAKTLSDAGLQPLDLEIFVDGVCSVAGVWKPLGDDDWYRSYASWQQILDRSTTLGADGNGGIILNPLKFLIDLDIDPQSDCMSVRPMPIMHDGPVGPLGP